MSTHSFHHLGQIEQEVLASLTAGPGQVPLRTAKLLALLIGQLQRSGAMTKADVGALMTEFLR
jgi:hypothetical protein